jgi:hypothetical protein
MRIFHRLHALQHDRPIPILAQEREVLPRSETRPTPSPAATRRRASSSARPPRRPPQGISGTRPCQAGTRGVRPGRTGAPMRCMNTESDVPTCTPTPAARGKYAVSRSFGRQPIVNESTVKTSAVKPAALARLRMRVSRRCCVAYGHCKPPVVE